MAIYFIIGLIYANYALIANLIQNGKIVSYKDFKESGLTYNDLGLAIRILAYAFDLLLWPVSIAISLYTTYKFNESSDE